jgi:hypothetical protein
MYRSAQWYREQSERAERTWQRACWPGRAAPEPAPQKATPRAAAALYPSHKLSVRLVETQHEPKAPRSTAAALYPSLKER